ncbi:multidrug ABC transporter ATP-binding protein [Kribbella sp. ALI-6-A]|uniref:ABC transporter ATP-binding protein n=1 Tax=Kribbella sp. ALI-6-A TaxID=1933817 RepID=UPI00097C3AE0|nr:ABC transporter ATP-binding protein [Kribbella sp. ALI-6-A]ONI69826.1 multidrug ABC transporter ATP-binding protein [Kribbella sp. ALI-6-A]
MAGDPIGPDGHLPVATKRETWRAGLSLIRTARRTFALMVLLNVLATVAALGGPWLFGKIVDAVASGRGGEQIDRLALLIVACALLQLVLTRWARNVGARFGERTSAQVRDQFLGRVLRLPAAVAERVPTGDITSRAATDVNSVAYTLRDAVPDALIAVLQTLFIFVAVFAVDPLMGACAVVGLSGIWFAGRWYLARARTAYLEAGAAASTLTEVLTATVSGGRTVEAFGLQERRLRASVEAIEHSRDTRLRTLALRTVLFPVVDVSYVLPLVGVLLVGGALYGNGQLTLGAIIAAVFYLRQLAGPLEVLELLIDQIQSSSASFARLEGIETMARPARTTSAEPVGDRIEVSGVSFAYPGGPDVLTDVSLAIQPGEHLAIVGVSGAGKSTLGRLLTGIEHPRTGSVTVGGVSVAELPPERLREQIVLVTQDHHVFADTVRDNLLIARSTATDEELRAALAAVGASWIDDLPDGLDTVLGNGGLALETSHAQQIALARVVLADPHTVVLDEATSMLDPTTARSVERALAVILDGRTVLAIAHRMHTSHDADRVAVMEAGRIIELGSHQELLERDGAYAALWRSWHGDSAD